MDDDNGGPDFSYAYAGGSASWNPALRPHTDDDVAPSTSELQEASRASTLQQDASPPPPPDVILDDTLPAITATPTPQFQTSDPPSENSEGGRETPTSAPQPSQLVDSAATSSQLVMEQVDAAQEIGYDGITNPALESSHVEETALPSDLYERQGESNAADEAVDEEPTASLLQDEEPLPTPGWDTTVTETQPSIDAVTEATADTAEYDWGAAEDQGFADEFSTTRHLDSDELDPESGLGDLSQEPADRHPIVAESNAQTLDASIWVAETADVAFTGTTEDARPYEGDVVDAVDRPLNTDRARIAEETLDNENASEQDLESTAERVPSDFEWGVEKEGVPFAEGLGLSHGLGDDVPVQDFASSSLERTETRESHTFGGVAASKATVFSEILQEKQADAAVSSNADEHIPPAEELQNDDEIAAMWKAALEDDDFLDDELLDDEVLNDTAVDPSGFFDDDGEGFLEEFLPETPQQVLSPSAPVPVLDSQGHTQGFSTLGQTQQQDPSGALPVSDRYAPGRPSQQASVQGRNQYSMPSPQFFDSSNHSRSAATPSSDLFGAFGQVPFDVSSAPQRPALPNSTQSFADKAREGYASPYDLPMDIVKPRKRQNQPMAPALQGHPPPPRSSSIPPGAVPQVQSPPGTQNLGGSPSLGTSSREPVSNHGSARELDRPVSKGGSGFFEDLPIAPKLRSRPSGMYTPGPVAAVPPPLPHPSRPAVPPAPNQTSQVLGGLRQPDRLPLLPDASSSPLAATEQHQTAPAAPLRYSPSAAPIPSLSARSSPMPPPAPSTASRYSPAPPGQVTQNKYASAPAQPANPQRAQPFAPRTSSPLAYQEKPQLEQAKAPSLVRNLSYQPMHATADSARQFPARELATPPPAFGQTDPVISPRSAHRLGQLPRSSFDGQRGIVASPPRMNGYLPSGHASPEAREASVSSYLPTQTRMPDVSLPLARGAHTQSPGAVVKGPKLGMSQLERPISATESFGSPQIHGKLALPARSHPSAGLDFEVPSDERAADPLERWKGSAIFKWSTSGILLSSFPKQVPIYSQAQASHILRCTAGSITIHDTKSTFPLSDRDAKFPGPLYGKGKGRKKEVIAWLAGKIVDLETAFEGAQLDATMQTDVKKRAEEKVVLWRVVKILVEQDNILDGKADIANAAREVLLPNLAQPDLSGFSVPGEGSHSVPSEPVTSQNLAEIRKHLLAGQREQAVWYAVEQRLWSHAMLISSTLAPEVWKQVIQEFVKAQVKGVGASSESLAALYEVFAGNWEESVDELVPPSARAGFQMVNKAANMSANAKNPLDGLDEWRETLGLIISNRSNNDGQAIAALGKLLASYGRVEAAHTCFIYARAFVQHTGADDPESTFVLLGADHKQQRQELGNDLDSILLTEVYEYALSLNPAPGSSSVIPHLQAYKLMHAYMLAQHGMRAEAQAYCDAIASAIKSSTRASPYYHAAFTSAVENLSRCLSQSPQTASSSAWLSKLSSDKVSGSVWKRFNTFVAGDESDQASNGSGTEGGAAGPFGKLSGESPTISRSASNTDLYSAMSMNGMTAASMAAPTAPSRYAPGGSGAVSSQPQSPPGAGGRYAPQANSAYAPSRPSIDSVRSYEPERPRSGQSMYGASALQPPSVLQRASTTPYGSYVPQVPAETLLVQALSVPRPEASRATSDYNVPYSQPLSRRPSTQDEMPPMAPYEPMPRLEQLPSTEGSPVSYGYQPFLSVDSPALSTTADTPGDDFEAPRGDGDEQSAMYEPPVHTFEPSAYAPPSGTTSYDPGSYAPTAESTFNPPASTTPAEYPSYEPLSYTPFAQTPSYQPSMYESGRAESPVHTSTYEPASYEPPTQVSSYEPSSYAPPAEESTYEAPQSYTPYEPQSEAENPDDSFAKPKKKSFMDDDDDDELIRRAAALRISSSTTVDKAAADKAADDAFRKAAEADAARDKAGDAPKKGWLGGWFKKDPNAAPGPIRAKLGEQSSFVFDPELKKWVDKSKQGGAAGPETPSSTPPPPRGPPSRSASAAFPPPAGPPSGPASRVASGVGFAGLAASGPPTPMSRPSTAGGLASPPLGQAPLGSGPPSRIGTPAGEAPALSAEGGAMSAPPSRPATSMSNASSIDDLLGAPQARKAGGVKPKKRGGRYVDVMAK